jgi:hypothetical protein
VEEAVQSGARKTRRAVVFNEKLNRTTTIERTAKTRTVVTAVNKLRTTTILYINFANEHIEMLDENKYPQS